MREGSSRAARLSEMRRRKARAPMSLLQEWMGKSVCGVCGVEVWVKRGVPFESRMCTIAPGRVGVGAEVVEVRVAWRASTVEGLRVGGMVGGCVARLMVGNYLGGFFRKSSFRGRVDMSTITYEFKLKSKLFVLCTPLFILSQGGVTAFYPTKHLNLVSLFSAAAFSKH